VKLFHGHQQDPEAIRMAAFTHQDPSDYEAHVAHWDRIRADPTVVIRTLVVGDEVVGHVASFEMFGERNVTYWLAREHWGRGHATQALRAFLAVDPVRPLYGRVASDNVASLRVLNKCGFVVTGTDRGYAHGRGREVEELVLALRPGGASSSGLEP